jgi:hypothetical protein
MPWRDLDGAPTTEENEVVMCVEVIDLMPAARARAAWRRTPLDSPRCCASSTAMKSAPLGRNSRRAAVMAPCRVGDR